MAPEYKQGPTPCGQWMWWWLMEKSQVLGRQPQLLGKSLADYNWLCLQLHHHTIGSNPSSIVPTLSDYQIASVNPYTYDAWLNALTLANKSSSYIRQVSHFYGHWWIIRCGRPPLFEVYASKCAMASTTSLARRLANSSGSSVTGLHVVAWATVKEDNDAFPSKILPVRWKILIGWNIGNNHSIDINKGVCNPLDANVCTISIDWRIWSFHAQIMTIDKLDNICQSKRQ